MLMVQNYDGKISLDRTLFPSIIPTSTRSEFMVTIMHWRCREFAGCITIEA